MRMTIEKKLLKSNSFPVDVDRACGTVPPYYPDIPGVRRIIVRQLSNVKEMDRQGCKLIQELTDAGLYNNTIIFFYSDHGEGLPMLNVKLPSVGCGFLVSSNSPTRPMLEKPIIN